jgi:aspartyl-tRNA synthetase
VKEAGAKGMAYLLLDRADAETPGDEPASAPVAPLALCGRVKVRSPIAKFLSEEELAAILAACRAEPEDLIALVADTPRAVAKSLDRLRREIGARCALADPEMLAFCWITDFPVFKLDDETGEFTYAHNPFSMPQQGHMELLDTDPLSMRAYCYDIACNGIEWASGSIRIHKPEIQRAILRKLGHSDEQIGAQFGHMLEAFSYGAPPHGGIAPGIDRLIMFLTSDENIREVIAFPKMGGGMDPMMSAPSEVDARQLQELGIRIVEKPASG